MTDFFDLDRQLANIGKHSHYANYIPSVLSKYAYRPWRPRTYTLNMSKFLNLLIQFFFPDLTYDYKIKTAQALLSLNGTEIVQVFDWQLHMFYTKAYLPYHTSVVG
jgi:hypothetical protein